MNSKKLNFKNYLFYLFLVSLLFIGHTKSLAASNYEVTIPDDGYHYMGVATNNCEGGSSVRREVYDTKHDKNYYGCLYDSAVTNPKVTCSKGYEAVRLDVTNKLYSTKSIVYLCKNKYEYQAKFVNSDSYTNVTTNACSGSRGYVGRKLVAFLDYSKARYACVYTSNAADFSPSVTCGEGYSVVRLDGRKAGTTAYDYIVLACKKNSSSDGDGTGGGTTGGGDTGAQGGGTGSDKEQGGGTIVPNVDPDWHYTPSTPSQNYDSACSIEGTRKAVILIGKAIVLATYIVPLIIIILGMIDFGKAVTSNDEKASSKATGAFIRRIVAGIVVFLIPTLLKALINVINVNSLIYDKDNYNECMNCLMHPFNNCSSGNNNTNSNEK